jgi:phage terminase large subunit-like protein
VVLRQPLDPWQQWVAIHIGELQPDGRPRFRQALIIVARQNGKTHLCKVLAVRRATGGKPWRYLAA